MTPSELRRLLALSVPCDTCSAGTTQPCTSASGAPTPPHPARLVAAGVPVKRRKGTPMGRPHDYPWYVACSTCDAPALSPCLGRDHGYHKSRAEAGEAYRVANGLPERRRTRAAAPEVEPAEGEGAADPNT
jgi:hypothetical protein